VKFRLAPELVYASWQALELADHVVLVVDSLRMLRYIKRNEQSVEEKLITQMAKKNIRLPMTIILNKVLNLFDY
jgi:hypothetical protein